MARTTVITGGASGLGKAFVESYARRNSKDTIIVIDHVPIAKSDNERIQFHQVDISLQESVNTFSKSLAGTPVHMLIHCAGIRGLVPVVEAEKLNDVAGCETLEVMDMDTMLRTFQLNTVGTLMLVQALLPNLRLALQDASKIETSAAVKVVIMGSRMGSIGYNIAGGGYAYRASKAALHAVVKSLSIDVPEVIFTILHPGRVETGLVKWREEGAITPEGSIADMWNIIDNLSPKDSGRLYDRFGDTIEW